jgi:glutaredoxin-related protein
MGNTQQSKERQIATQSSLKTILEWSASCGKCLELKELVAITNVIVDYVEMGYSKELGDRLDKIQDHLDNKGIPKK